MICEFTRELPLIKQLGVLIQKNRISHKLTSEADGMFLWVRLGLP